MNEVSRIEMAAPLVAGAASSKGTKPTENNESASGKNLPPQSTVYSPVEGDTSPPSIDSAVSDINDYVQSVQRDLRFSVDEELDRTVIRVVDTQTGDVIRQIPEEIFLELARNLKDNGEFQLLKAIG